MSDFFATVRIDEGASIRTDSDGDLWPTTWADDGHLYTANGDGAGFSDGEYTDIVVSRIEGTPASGITGERLASGRDVAPIWGDPAMVNSKPTGIVAVDGNGDGRDELYLAVQDLACTPDRIFDEAPAAGVVASEDYGRTWRAPDGPMFTDHTFTTVMFLDFGRSQEHARVLGTDGTEGEGYVYAYGLDGNWRTSHKGIVPDPQELFLARVRADRVLRREAWEFYCGRNDDGTPRWHRDIGAKRPVLTDRRRPYAPHPDAVTVPRSPEGPSVIAQGGIVYNAPLRRFLYSSWSEFTLELYEAPAPWGPWRHVVSHDFGPFPWTGPLADHPRHGGYGTTIPAKFISADGQDMWLQSNWFVRASSYHGSAYHYSLRHIRLAIRDDAPASNTVDPAANLARETGAVPIASTTRSGHPEVLTDGATDRAEDSWNGSGKQQDHWGVTWPRHHRVDTVRWTSGPRDYNGGWFARPPAIEIRSAGRWRQVADQVIDRPYATDATSTGRRAYTVRFAPVEADGIRLVGPPGGWSRYSTLSELEVYHSGGGEVPAS